MRTRFLLSSMIMLMTSTPVFAEDITLHVYGQAPGTPGGWALIPETANLRDASAPAIFEALRRKKLPTYGDTRFDAATSSVTIDPTKCAYSAIITTELSRSFEQNGHSLKSATCAGKPSQPSPMALARSVSVLPLWLAIGERSASAPRDTWVDVAGAPVRFDDFSARLKSGDKKLLKSIEGEFDSPSEFVQRQTMSAAVTAGLPGAEALVAKRLSHSVQSVQANAARALKNSTNAKMIAQIRDLIAKAPYPDKLLYAESAFGSSDVALARDAALALLGSSDGVLFQHALSALTAAEIAASISILDQVRPEFAASVADTQFGHDETALSGWLASRATPEAASGANVLSVARVASARAQASETVVTARTILMLAGTFDEAEDSFYQLTRRSCFDQASPDGFTERQTAALRTALRSSDPVIAQAAYDAVTPPPPMQPEFDVSAAQKRAYDVDWKVREATARELDAATDAADAVRKALVKDSEPAVSEAMIQSIGRQKATRFARELIDSSRGQPIPVRRVILRTMPFLLDDANSNAVTAYVSNELFDSDVDIRIAALHALARIARITADPVIADNAISSISMSLQDRDPRVRRHTALALAESGSSGAAALIETLNDPSISSQAMQRMSTTHN